MKFYTARNNDKYYTIIQATIKMWNFDQFAIALHIFASTIYNTILDIIINYY